MIATDAAGTPIVRMVLDGHAILTQKTSSQVRIPFDKLPEGLHTLVVTATDLGHHVTRQKRTFLVNSTEKLGKATLIYGARGRDVKTLQRRAEGPGLLPRAHQRRSRQGHSAAVKRSRRRSASRSTASSGPR